MNSLTLPQPDEPSPDTPRDTAWLAARVHLLRTVHFADVPQGYPITTRFGTRARYRFGSISSRNGQTLILVNQLFADPFVPDYVVDGTLAHELAHYAHGFGSGLPRLVSDPHRGGVVDRELAKRGLGELNQRAEQWREACWDAFYDSRCTDIARRRAAKIETVTDRWQTFLNRPGNRSEAELQARLLRVADRFGLSAALTPFGVAWLHATRRQSGLSYWYAKSRLVRLHGLLADRRIPDDNVDFELAYWIARLRYGASWTQIHNALCIAGLEAAAESALRWRRCAWTAFCNRHHPLNTGQE